MRITLSDKKYKLFCVKIGVGQRIWYYKYKVVAKCNRK